MSLTATLNLTVTPPTLTVVSDKRVVSVVVTAVGETTTATGWFPVVKTDSSGRVWTQASDNGTTSVYTG